MANNKTKLVVLNENTLGYILPELPNYVQHLHASVLRGAVMGSNNSLIIRGDIVRLASEEDFNEYNVYFGSFGNSDEYEFAHSTAPYPTWEFSIGKVLDKKAEANKQYR